MINTPLCYPRKNFLVNRKRKLKVEQSVHEKKAVKTKSILTEKEADFSRNDEFCKDTNTEKYLALFTSKDDEDISSFKGISMKECNFPVHLASENDLNIETNFFNILRTHNNPESFDKAQLENLIKENSGSSLHEIQNVLNELEKKNVIMIDTDVIYII